MLLEQELVAHNDVEDQVCPLLLMLTNADAHDDFRTEAAAVSLPFYIFLFKFFIVSCEKQMKSVDVKDMGSEMLACGSSTPLTTLSFMLRCFTIFLIVTST